MLGLSKKIATPGKRTFKMLKERSHSKNKPPIALEDRFEAGVAAEDGCLFPCLIELDLYNCPKLKELPSLPPKLKSLKIGIMRPDILPVCHLTPDILPDHCRASARRRSSAGLPTNTLLTVTASPTTLTAGKSTHNCLHDRTTAPTIASNRTLTHKTEGSLTEKDDAHRKTHRELQGRKFSDLPLPRPSRRLCLRPSHATPAPLAFISLCFGDRRSALAPAEPRRPTPVADEAYFIAQSLRRLRPEDPDLQPTAPASHRRPALSLYFESVG
ncbi:hypothetical protein M5K25_009884 [Dendrobium thyrsiflorum]|uniref:Uncharacterized protein n=1 Tax=Dendrobium thyrsiflorum TaxID=117978 RepID=A0ABD0VDX6_DENTH